jgi:hypothetical protein
LDVIIPRVGLSHKAKSIARFFFARLSPVLFSDGIAGTAAPGALNLPPAKAQANGNFAVPRLAFENRA